MSENSETISNQIVVSICADALDILFSLCHQRSRDAGWYTDPRTGQPLERNVGEMIALIHSELSEALEGYRKDLMDDHIPSRKMIEVELADAIIRIGDMAGYLRLNVGSALKEKMEYNRTRADHKLENRAKGGKKF